MPRPEGAAALRALRGSDTGRAAGMGLAVAASNVASLLFTVVFARVLGAGDYASLAALLSAFLVLALPGTAVQTAVARDVASEAARGELGEVAAAVRRWLGAALAGGAAAGAVALLAREPLADLIGVDDAWAAFAMVPAAALWFAIAVERGALQGLGRYRAVGMSMLVEAAGRLVGAAVLVAAGLGVAGAFLGYAIAPALVGVALAVLLARELPAPDPAAHPPSLRALVAAAGAPAATLALLAALQNVDVIIAKRELADAAAGAFATASLVAKSVVWVAYGLSLYVVPEAARRAALAEPTAPLLRRTAALTLGAGLVLLALVAVAGGPLLRTVFGDAFGAGDRVLPALTVAFTLLALAYLAAQYLLALRRSRFLLVLGLAALAQPVVLTLAGPDARDIALALVALAAALLAALLAVERRGTLLS